MKETKLKPIFSGIIKFTTQDDFGNLSATLFTNGCNLKCKYCYNIKFLNINNKTELINNDEIISFLKKRIGILESITICGGEPTIHNENLINWLYYIKSLGYKIKLDTNGTNPSLINEIIENNLVNFIALDFKGPKNKFNKITNTNNNFFEKFEESIKLIISSKIKYDIRTTIHSSLIDYNDLIKMKKYLIKMKSQNWSLQKFLDVKTLENLEKDETNFEELKKENFEKEFKYFKIRK